jgi:hypothetical protein
MHSNNEDDNYMRAWEAKAKEAWRLVAHAWLLTAIMFFLVVAILVVRCSSAPADGGDPTPTPTPGSCGDLALGDYKREQCADGTTFRNTVCTQRGLEVTVKCAEDGNQGGNPGACVDYSKVKTAIDGNCISCHRNDLGSYQAVKERETQALGRIQAPKGEGRHMPPGKVLDDSTTALFKAWVDGGLKETCGNGSPAPSGKFTLDDVENDIVNDLLAADEDDRANYRYLVVAHKLNEGQDAETLEKMVNKTINSVSVERKLFKAVPTSGSKAVYRIDLDELGINAQEWLLIAQNDKVKLVSQTTKGKLAQTLIGLGPKDPVWFHAENFADVVHKAPVYRALVDIPATFPQFTQAIGVDYAKELKDGDALLACITESSISASAGNRMVSFHESNNSPGKVGGLVVTYDPRAFNGDDTRNCFSNPFLFQTGQRRNFNFDASESLDLLDNGMLRAGLWAELEQVQNVNGKPVIVNRFPNAAQDAAPTDIVADSISPVGVGPAINEALSCPVCHNQGLIPINDEVRLKLDRDPRPLNAAEVQAAEDLYRGRDDVNAAIARVNEVFQGALRTLGINPADPDPITQFTNQFKLPWGLEQTCAFVLIPDIEQCKSAIQRSESANEAFGQLLTGGKVTQAIVLNELQRFIDEALLFRDR